MSDALDVLRDADELELVTRGRRTGRPHAVTLWSALDGSTLWLRADADADWYRNLVADPRCEIRAGGRAYLGTFVPADDAEAALRRLVELWREKYGREWVGDWYVERGRVPVRIAVTPRA
jgi:hypothetical protein